MSVGLAKLGNYFSFSSRPAYNSEFLSNFAANFRNVLHHDK